MVSNVALDVVIGLVFIYLLYSLLATTIKEFIATIFSYRGRMLERGIEQMLDGKNYSYYWWEKVINFFLWIYMWLSKYAHFLLKYYNDFENWKKEKKQREKGLENEITNDAQSIKSEYKLFSDYRKEQAQENTSKTRIVPKKIFFSKEDINADKSPKYKIARIKLNSKAALFAANITEHPVYKRSAENSILFKKPAYLNADSFSDILIDILGGNKSKGPNEPVLMKDIAAYANLNLKENPELQKILGIFIEQANGDLQRFKGLIEKWYDDTMDRVSGWYKKQANRILIIIGFVLAVVFNVSTIEIVDKLSKDKTARNAIVQNASAYIKANPHLIEPAKSNGNDSVDFETAKKNIAKIRQLADTALGQSDAVMGLGWDFKKTDLWYRKVFHVLKETFGSPRRWLGFLLTAFAISLGAPFWFDLLNKFINLRVSGTKPEESKKDNTASKTAGLNQNTLPNPKAFG